MLTINLVKMVLGLIVGITKSNGIGKDGGLPWHFTEDLKNFQSITKRTTDKNKQNAIIMGRNTMNSIKRLPLGGRINVCISRTQNSHPCGNIIFYNSLDSAVLGLSSRIDIENIFIIGGEMLYKEVLKRDDCTHLYINSLNTDVVCDTFFPEIEYSLYDIINIEQISKNVIARQYKKK